jgi:hypothetical protein
MSTIPDKLTFPKGTKAQLQPARTIPEVTMPMDGGLDFTSPNVRWHDDPNGQTLSVTGLAPGSIQVMGKGAKTAYNAAWGDNDARHAYLVQLELPVQT